MRGLAALIIFICLYPVVLPAEQPPRTVITSYNLHDNDSISFCTGTSMGILIPAGQSIEFIVPEAFKNRLPNFARIRHRKDRTFLAESAAEFDPDSPWLSVYFHNPRTSEWVVWQDQFGSKKRSAVCPPAAPKQNTLYNFPEFVGMFSPDRIRVYNHSEGDPARATASLHGIEVFYLSADNNSSEKTQSKIVSNFEKLNSATLKYSLDHQIGIELSPGENIEFEFPDEFKHRDIIQVVLKHRKDLAYAADPQDYNAFDPNAAYILCEAHNSLNKLWYKWADRSSIAKFSEVRAAENAENETLHNCLRTFGSIKPDKFRITNVGKGDPKMSTANIHELEIIFVPASQGGIKIERIFTPETAFSDMQAAKPVPLLGGGPRLGGRFPGAVLLGKNRAERAQRLQQLPEQFRFDLNNEHSADGSMLIELPPGYKIELVELALGDLDITSLEHNKDGYFGRSGQAQASIFIVTAIGKNIALIRNNNIGMAGFVTCGGPVTEYISNSGDHLLIKITNDEAFLMGYRITLSKQ